jgi:tight adherence protein B
VVLLTDGGDTTSTTSLDATVAALAASGVPLFAVELRTAESNPVALSRLTNASAGRVVAASDPTGLAGAFDAIARQLVRQYAVTYTSTAHGAVDIDVTVESQGVRATARRHLDLPGAPVAPPGTTAAAGTVDGQVDSPRIGGWALAVGGALCGAALLGLLIPVVLSRTPRALGLATRRRGISLSGAATRAEAFGDTVLRRGGGHGAVSGVIEQAGLDVRPGELFVGVVVGSLAALLLGWVVVAPFVGAVLAAGVALSARIVLDVMARRRRTRFNAQLGETLQMLAGSLRAGHGLAQGVDSVSRESESPTAEEFRRLTIETRLGRDLVEALRALAARVGSDDFEWVVQAIEIQRDVGGDLAEVLDTVAGTIRDRARIRQQVSALSAEGRMSAWVLMLLPFGLLGMMSVTNREYLSPLFDSGTGHVLLGMGAVLLVVGGLWLKRIVKPVF